MSKKYKLIKQYDGSPQVGTIVNQSIDFPHYNFNGGNFTTAITQYFVENTPEFWEEIKEKEYLFLSDDNVEIFKGDGYYQVTPEFKYYFIGNNDYKRRNCDKHFSTERAAKDWIETNKPQFSINDLKNASISYGYAYINGKIQKEYFNINLDMLKELKKNK